MRALLSKGLGFGIPVLLSGFVQLAVIPVVIAVAGPTVWGQLAIAQAAGTMAAVVVAYGWNLIGPATVAGMPVEQRGMYYFNSLVSRVLLFVVAGAAYWIAVWLILGKTPEFTAVLLGGLSLVIGALGGAWFFTGEGSPTRLVLAVTAPITLFTLIGAGLYLWQQQLVIFTGVQLIGYLLSVVFSAAMIARRYPTVLDLSVRRALARLRESFSAVVTAVTSSLYVNAPVIILNFLAPAAVPLYAVVDRILKFAQAGAAPITQLAQYYVPETAQTQQRWKRIILGLSLALSAALLLATLFALLAPLAGNYLSAQQLPFGFELSLPFALTLFATVISGVTGLAILTALDRFRDVAMSTVLGALLGLTLSFILGAQFGAVGVAWAVAITELAITSYQLLRVFQLRRRFPVAP